MNPDADPAAGNLISRFLRLFQKHEQQRATKMRRASSHGKRGTTEMKKRRRQLAQDSRRDQRRLAKGQAR